MRCRLDLSVALFSFGETEGPRSAASPGRVGRIEAIAIGTSGSLPPLKSGRQIIRVRWHSGVEEGKGDIAPSLGGVQGLSPAFDLLRRDIVAGRGI